MSHAHKQLSRNDQQNKQFHLTIFPDLGEQYFQ